MLSCHPISRPLILIKLAMRPCRNGMVNRRLRQQASSPISLRISLHIGNTLLQNTLKFLQQKVHDSHLKLLWLYWHHAASLQRLLLSDTRVSSRLAIAGAPNLETRKRKGWMYKSKHLHKGRSESLLPGFVPARPRRLQLASRGDLFRRAAAGSHWW